MLASAVGATALAGVGLAAALFHTLNHALFKSAPVPRRRVGPVGDGDPRPQPPRRPGPGDAAHRPRLRDRGGGDQRPAAAQRLRQRVADVPGPARGRRRRRAVARWRGSRRLVAVGRARPDRGARRRLLRQGHRDDLPRPAAQPALRPRAREVGRRDARADGGPCRSACVGGRRRWPRPSSPPSPVSPGASRMDPPPRSASAAAVPPPTHRRLSRRRSSRWSLGFVSPALVAHLALSRTLPRGGRRHGRAASCPSPRSSTPRRATPSSIRLFFEPVLRPERETRRRAPRRARRSRGRVRYRGEVDHVIDDRAVSAAPSRRQSPSPQLVRRLQHGQPPALPRLHRRGRRRAAPGGPLMADR